MKNVQETVFEIIKLSKRSGLRHISKKQIMAELKETPLGAKDVENYSGKKSKLETQLDQALYQLAKKQRIKMKGKGKYAINTSGAQYRPVICRHLQKTDKGFYCPIKKVYIGDPTRQCELIHGTDFSRLIKTAEPMCPGYTDRKPTAVSIKASKEAIEAQRKERDERFKVRRYERGGF